MHLSAIDAEFYFTYQIGGNRAGFESFYETSQDLDRRAGDLRPGGAMLRRWLNHSASHP
jgi:hypothetical protein